MAIEMLCEYSTISSKDLMQKVLPDYCIDQPLKCLFWERGANDNYQVVTADKRYSLRIYRHGINSRDEIDFEVAALNHLHKKGFPVAFPIPRKSGEYITEIQAPEGIRHILLTAFAEGGTPDYESDEDFRLTGESVANLHQASDDFKTSHKRPMIDLDIFIGDRFRTIEPHIAHRPEKLAQLKHYLETASNAIQKVGVETMDFGFCHGDIHGGNAHLHEGVLRHFDFEECGLGFRIFDIATFKWGSLDNAQPERWTAFLEGYESIRKISDADLELLDTFILLRHIWLISFHMRNATDFGCDLLSDEYIDRQWSTLKQLSTDGIGAVLDTENECTVVVRTISGGAAAKSGLLNAGDRIVGVSNGEDGEIVDTLKWSLNDIVDLIVGPKGTTVRLKVIPANAPADADAKVVSIVRDKIRP